MKIKEGKVLSRNSIISYCKAIIKVEQHLSKVFEIWNKFDPETSYADQLEESPWLSPASCLFLEIEEDFTAAISQADLLKANYESFGTTNATKWCWRIFEYFIDGAGPQLMNMISMGDCNDDYVFLNQHKVLLEKVYRYSLAVINEVFEVSKILNGEEIPDLLLEAGSECNVDILDYCKYIDSLSNKMPKSVNNYVNDELDFIQGLLARTGADEDMFFYYSEAVMPYDIVAMKNNDLVLDDDYIKRLIERVENEFSLYNTTPMIYDICNLIPVDYAIKVYKYEQFIKDTNLVDIRDGKYTLKSFIDKLEKESLSDPESSQTDLF